MRNQFKKYEKEFIILAVAIQIFLLLLSLPANTYTIRESYSATTQNSINGNSNQKTSSFFSSVANVLSWLFMIKQIGTVSAADTLPGCCVTSDSCTPASSSSDCSSPTDYVPNTCDSDSLSASCGPTGTCVDTSGGTCQANVRDAICSNNGGTWYDKSLSEVQDSNGNYLCQNSCCDFGGTDQRWIPYIQCTSEGHTVLTGTLQADCGTSKTYGACVDTSNKGCTMTIKSDCKSPSVFHGGLLCTNPGLHTKCAPTDQNICGTGQQSSDVYFVDNCSNIANPYNKDKIITNLKNLADPNWAYWNYTVTENSQVGCSAGSGKNCGLCNYPSKSICRQFNSKTDLTSEKNTGDYFCAPLTCNVTNNKFFPNKTLGRFTANNGESWCVYQGHVGESEFNLSKNFESDPLGSYSGKQYYSSDAVGSYSGMQVCNNGVIKNDTGSGLSNTEYRMSICGELINKSSSDQKKWTVTAQIRPNYGLGCLNVSLEKYPLDKDKNASVIASKEAATHQFNQQACENFSAEDANGVSGNGGPDCRLQTVNLTKYNTKLSNHYQSNFIFDICVPRYPIGFDLSTSKKLSTEEQKIQASKSVCSIGSFNCTTVWVQYGAKHFCVENCQCLTQNFANQMNDLCTSLGDCGGYVNIAGTYTKNFQTFKGNLPGDYHSIDHNAWGYNYNTTANGNINQSIIGIYQKLLDNPNAVTQGSSPGNTPWYAPGQFLTAMGFPNMQIGTTGDLSINKNIGGIIGVVIGSVGILSSLSGEIAVIHFIAIGAPFTLTNPVGWIISGVLLVIGTLLAVFSWLGFLGGNQETLPIQFKCQPWTPPRGSDNCGQCGKFGLPCTQYQCESLGSCELVESSSTYGSPNPTCVKKVTSPPIIKFDNMPSSLGYTTTTNTGSSGMEKGFNVSTGGSNPCLQGGSRLNFSLETFGSGGDYEKSYCGWSYNESAIQNLGAGGFDLTSDNLNTFFQGSAGTYFWNFSSNLPLLSELPTSQVFDEGKKAHVNIYVVCESATNQRSTVPVYTVNLCINNNPDPNPAVISSFLPLNDSYVPSRDNQMEVNFSVSKAANCSWDYSDKPYSQMSYKLNGSSPGNYCTDLMQLGSVSKELCHVNMTNLNSGSNNQIYIRCNTKNNIENDPGIYYTLKLSQEELNITKIYVTVGKSIALDISGQTNTTVPASVIGTGHCFPGTGPGTGNNCILMMYLNATTSKGADGNGNSKCTYKFNQPPEGSATFSSDLYSYNSNHSANINLDITKYYNATITCKDRAGNNASRDALFKFNPDLTPPNVTRISKSDSVINITTDELAKCYYNLNGCSFDINGPDSHSMDNPSIPELIHKIYSSASAVYYIKCIDIYGNANPSCAATVSSGY